MQIYENSREFTKVEIYLMTSSPDVISLKTWMMKLQFLSMVISCLRIKTRMAKKLIFSHLSHQTKSIRLSVSDV